MSSTAQPVNDSATVMSTATRLQSVTPLMPTEEVKSRTATAGSGWIHDHWSAGVIGGLVIVELLALFVCLVDLVHFSLTGLSIGNAWGMVLEATSFEKWTALAEAVFVFSIFFFLLPLVTAGLLAVLRGLANKIEGRRKQPENEALALAVSIQPPVVAVPSRRLRSLMFRHGKIVWALHFLFSAAISIFTVVMESGQVLAGNSYTAGAGLHPSFFSLWLSMVFAVKIITPAFFLPVGRKYLVRMFGGENPHFREVLSEIFTEEGLNR